MNKINGSRIARVFVASMVFALTSTFCSSSYSQGLQPGSRYKILRPVYLMAVYDDVDNKRLSRETARAYLNAQKLANRYFTAFQSEVSAGTIMTIIGPAPKTWSLPFFADSYTVRLDPDLSRGLNIELKLNRGIEGNLDGLNPELFDRL